jgi:hypothetical protein
VGNLNNYVTAPKSLSFVEVGGVTKIFTISRYANWVNIFDIPTGSVATGAYWPHFWINNLSFGRHFAQTKSDLVIGASNGLVSYLKDNRLAGLNNTPAGAVIPVTAYVTPASITGWMPGDIRGAFLADTDDADLVGGAVFEDNFDAGIADWVPTTAYNSIVTAMDGKIRIQVQPDQNYSFANRTFTGLTIGRAYQFRINIKVNAGAALLYLGFSGQGTAYHTNLPVPAGQRLVSFVARNTSLSVGLGAYTANANIEFDDLVVQVADADRSVNNKGLIVNGTITRAPVTPGAELVAYSGFSAANFLEQSYNAGLDFGTGGFCAMGWVRQIAGSAGYVIERRDHAAVGNYIRIYLGGDTIPVFGTNGRTLVGSRACGLNQWAHVCCIRNGSTMAIYVNGVLDTTANGQFDVTNVGAVLRLGRTVNVGALQFFGSLALWRIGATVPNADQISKIYEDERKLFQPGAQCTLFGTSDAVTALAYDPKTSLLHVGTSQGRSVFDGLVRVANTEIPVTTAISAVGGMIAEQ